MTKVVYRIEKDSKQFTYDVRQHMKLMRPLWTCAALLRQHSQAWVCQLEV